MGLEDSERISSIQINPENPDEIYVGVLGALWGDSEVRGVYKTTDGGKNWKQLNNDFELTVRPFYFSRIVVDPTNPDKVCKAGLRGSISEDGGKTFRQIGSGVHADVHDFWFAPDNPDQMFLGCDGGVYRSYDGGRSWEICKDLPITQFYHVTVDMQEPFNVYGGMQDNGSWVGPSASVGGVEARDWQEVGYGDGFRVYPHPSDPNICYSEMQGAESIWRVDLDKQQSKIIKPYPVEGDPKLRFNWNTPITTSQFYPDRLYVGSQFVHRSDDQGETWTKISPDLTTNDPVKQNQEDSGGLSKDNSGAENHCTIFTIAESPLSERVIWAGTDDGQVQLTTDGGKNWTNVTANIPNLPANTWVHHIEPSSFDRAVAYAVFDGHTRNDRNPYVYKTQDGGETWQSITTPDIEGFARSIQEDYVNPNLLYLGTEMGLFLTLDGGQNWTKFTNNMPAAAVHHVTLHSREHSLVMGTHGRGIIIVDDVRPLRALQSDVVEQDVHFFESTPAIIKEQPSFGSAAAYGEFVGSNPSPAAKITYYLKKRHIFGKMNMEIFDENGEQVASLTPGKSKSINIVEWNYRLRRPKIAKAKTFSFGGFATPTVRPGKYTVRLTKGKEAYEHTIELVSDPNSIHSAEDRAVQHKTVMELYRMNEELAYQVDRIEQLKAGIAEIEASDLPKRLHQPLKELEAQLEEMRKQLVVTTGDNYVASAEPQLRENIASLYSEVANYRGRPSNAQLKAKALRQRELNSAVNKLEKLLSPLPKVNKQLTAQGLPALDYRSKEAFLAAD